MLFPFQDLPWKGWVFRSAFSCPLRLLGPGHGIRSFGCHPSRKFFHRVEFIAALFPPPHPPAPRHSSNASILKAEQGRGQSILSFNFGKTAGYGALGKCSHRCINLFKNSWQSNPLSNKTQTVHPWRKLVLATFVTKIPPSRSSFHLCLWNSSCV